MGSGRKALCRTLCLLDKLSNIFSRVFLSTVAATVFHETADSSTYRLAMASITTRVTQPVFNKSRVHPHNPLLFIQLNEQSVKSQLYDSIENRCRKPVAVRKSAVQKRINNRGTASSTFSHQTVSCTCLG